MSAAALSSQNWDRPDVECVAEGVHRIPLPLFGDHLRAVNVYAIESDTGVTLIDGGWAKADARERLDSALAALGYQLRDINRVLVTHMHRDHYTLAVALRREFGTPVSLGAGERPSIESMRQGNIDAKSMWLPDLLANGAEKLLAELDDTQIDLVASEYGKEFPDVWLRDGEHLELGDRGLKVLATPGHTQGHIVFVDEQSGLFFAGDHVLPHITPSIGVEVQRSRLALREYMSSLVLVKELPDMRLLPAHGPVTDSVHDRADQLIDHHVARLNAISRLLGANEATAGQLAQLLPWTKRDRAYGELDGYNKIMAILETAAHLEVLVATGRAARRDSDVLVTYSSPRPTAVPS